MTAEDNGATMNAVVKRIERPGELTEYMPAVSIEQAAERFDALRRYVKTQMVDGKDYGRVPGSDKPTLLKPGAEKLCSFFGLSVPKPEFIEHVKDWTGREHGGEPFFYCEVSQRLERNGHLVAEQVGSCNSWETKYRYRKGERVCPACRQACIIKGKEEYGGGWVCFRKKGGCGATFHDGDQSIESQNVGRVANKDIYDSVNTIQKMAQKRALIAATLIAVNASEFFTQDLEDIQEREHDGPACVTPQQVQELRELIREARGEEEPVAKHYGVDSLARLPAAQFADAKQRLEAKAVGRAKAYAEAMELVNRLGITPGEWDDLFGAASATMTRQQLEMASAKLREKPGAAPEPQTGISSQATAPVETPAPASGAQPVSPQPSPAATPHRRGKKATFETLKQQPEPRPITRAQLSRLEEFSRDLHPASFLQAFQRHGVGVGQPLTEAQADDVIRELHMISEGGPEPTSEDAVTQAVGQTDEPW